MLEYGKNGTTLVIKTIWPTYKSNWKNYLFQIKQTFATYRKYKGDTTKQNQKLSLSFLLPPGFWNIALKQASLKLQSTSSSSETRRFLSLDKRLQNVEYNFARFSPKKKPNNNKSKRNALEAWTHTQSESYYFYRLLSFNWLSLSLSLSHSL